MWGKTLLFYFETFFHLKLAFIGFLLGLDLVYCLNFCNMMHQRPRDSNIEILCRSQKAMK